MKSESPTPTAPNWHPIRGTSATLWLALAGLLAYGLVDLPPSLGQEATSSEICEKDRLNGPPANPAFCGRWPNPVFWVPASCPSSSSPLTGSAIPRSLPAQSTTILYNRATRRPFQLIGTTASDIIVGSPTSSDLISGLGGNNTYVVGGGTSVLLSDRSFNGAGNGGGIVLSPTPETDSLTLEAAAVDYIHISLGGQWSPGTITTPLGNVGVRGSSSLPASKRGSACGVISWSTQTEPAISSPRALLAKVTQPAPTDTPAGLFTYVAQRLQTSPVNGNPGQESSPIVGAPVLRGFQIAPDSRDRIFLPAADFTFNNRPILDLFPEGQIIPVRVINDIRSTRARVVTPEELKRLQEQARGFENVRSDITPMVYFSQSGLLVFSQNSEPLGSRRNPGRVIAQLLTERGQPLAIPGSATQPFPAKFLIFTPKRTNDTPR